MICDAAVEVIIESMGMIDIHLPYGQVHASRDQGIIRARGIRYAVSEPTGEPGLYRPGGNQSLQQEDPPVSPQTESMVLKTIFGGFPKGTEQSPHCQYLSVTAPADTSQASPVLVWLHGGGYANSGPEFPAYDPEALVTEQGLVVVKPAFRLGYLGFGGAEEGHPANLGAMDVVTALRWIQDNIEDFGGDPSNVTIAGESSGADLALSLLAVEGAKGHFHGVIAQSPPLGIHPMKKKHLKETLLKAGLRGTDDYSTAQAKIEKAAWAKGAGFMPFGIRWGEAPYPAGDRIARIAEHASGRRVMIGVNSDESGHYLMGIPVLKDLYYNKWTFPILRLVLIKPTTWAIFSRASRKLFRKLKVTTRAAFYKFSLADRPAVHMSELPLIFGDVNNPAWDGSPLLPQTGEADRRRAHEAGRRMRQVWGDFTRNGRTSGFSDSVAKVDFVRDNREK